MKDYLLLPAPTLSDLLQLKAEIIQHQIYDLYLCKENRFLQSCINCLSHYMLVHLEDNSAFMDELEFIVHENETTL